VLIPAVLLHDIGFFTADFKTLGHDVTGARLAREWLQETGGYSDEQIAAICHCVRAHKGKAETPQSLEAKILYDADVLEKAGATYLILGGKVICEFNEPLEHFLKRETADRAREASCGLYTRKGRELDNGRLERASRLLGDVQREVHAERSDMLLDESVLWAGRPPR
jgi:HD superfamily phosphodiesterase